MSEENPENFGHNPHWMDRQQNQRRAGARRGASARERARESLLLAWYGQEEGRLEIMAHQRPAAHIGEAVGGVMAKFGMKNAVMVDDLRDKWPGLVGQDVAKFAQPTRCRDGVLMVEVIHSAWLYVLEREHRATIEARLSQVTQGKVTSVQFVPAGRRYER